MARLTNYDLAQILANNPELRIASDTGAKSPKTPESLIPARLPRLDSSQQNPLAEASQPAEPQMRVNGDTKKRKYGNNPVDVGGIHYDSQKEANRHQELLLLERAGAITNLVLKPKYVFEHNGVRIASFTPDFSYQENGQTVIEDTKGIDKTTGKKPTATEGYRLRKKLLKAFYGLDVIEV